MLPDLHMITTFKKESDGAQNSHILANINSCIHPESVVPFGYVEYIQTRTGFSNVFRSISFGKTARREVFLGDLKERCPKVSSWFHFRENHRDKNWKAEKVPPAGRSGCAYNSGAAHRCEN